MPLTTGQYKTILQESNRDYYNRKTWENLLSQNQQSAIAAENQLVKDYTQASTAAYTSYLQNRANIESSALFGESKQKMLSENQLNLEEAYNTYRQNLAQNEQAVQKSYQEGASAIDEALTKRAENFAAYENAAYDYTKYLFEKAPQLAADPRFSNYFTQDAIWDETANEGKGDWERDEEGNIRYGDARLKTVDELYKDFYTYNEELGRYESNEDLTDYLDFVENYIGQGEIPEGLDNIMSWEDYIRGTNPDLADYMFTGDPYNYTKEGTVAGSFRTLTGRESTDRDWSYAERVTGIKATQINKQYENFKNDLDNILNSTDDKSKEQTTKIKDLATNFTKVAKDMGIDKGLEQELGMSLDTLVTGLTDIESLSASESDKFWNIMNTSVASFAAGTAGAAATGSLSAAATVGSTLLGGAAGLTATGVGAPVGAIVAAIGAALMFANGIYSGVREGERQDAQNREFNRQATDAFNNVLIAMTKYAESQKQASAIKSKSRLY